MTDDVGSRVKMQPCGVIGEKLFSRSRDQCAANWCTNFNCSLGLCLGFGDGLGLWLSSGHLLLSGVGLGLRFWVDGRCAFQISSLHLKCVTIERAGQ